MKKRTALKVILTFLSLLIVFVGIVKFKYGTGKEYPDLGAALPTEAFALEKLIQLDYPPGNLAVADNGDVYFNYHPLAKAERFAPWLQAGDDERYCGGRRNFEACALFGFQR